MRADLSVPCTSGCTCEPSDGGEDGVVCTCPIEADGDADASGDAGDASIEAQVTEASLDANKEGEASLDANEEGKTGLDASEEDEPSLDTSEEGEGSFLDGTSQDVDVEAETEAGTQTCGVIFCAAACACSSAARSACECP
jgi:hypothetical protein